MTGVDVGNGEEAPGFPAGIARGLDRFIENRFDLPAMTARDANAWPMLDMFDFESPPFATPPGGAPPATVDQAHSDWCANNPPGTGMP